MLLSGLFDNFWQVHYGRPLRGSLWTSPSCCSAGPGCGSPDGRSVSGREHFYIRVRTHHSLPREDDVLTDLLQTRR